MVNGLRRTARRPPRDSGWRAAAVVGGALLLGSLLAAPLAYLAIRSSEQPAHRSLQPIAIPGRACPAIHRIQTAAQSFETAFYAADASTKPWPTSRARLSRVLRTLDRTISRNGADLPASVRVRLEVVQANARRGRAIVATSHNFADLMNHGYRQVDDAYSAYGDAATLVGDACGSLEVVRDAASPDLAREFARIASWVCGRSRARCVTTTSAR